MHIGNISPARTRSSIIRPFESSALHYSEMTITSSFHHTPRFIRAALDTIARGEVSARDFVTEEIPLSELPSLFQRMKNRNGQLKVAVLPS